MNSDGSAAAGRDDRRWIQLAGRVGAPLARALTHSSGRVLMYHRFGPGTTRRLDPAAFERHLQYLVRHFDVRPLAELAATSRTTRPARRQAVALTVDDGYADFAEHAYPLLQRYGVPATIFVVTRFLDGTFWLWFDAVHYLLHATGMTKAHVMLASRALTLDLSSAAARERAWSVIGDHCLRMDPRTRRLTIERLQQAVNVPLPAAPTAEYRAMTWEQLSALNGELISVGSHTCTHPVLSRCSDAEIAEEVTTSRRQIAARLKRNVAAFCYPNGQPEDYDARCIDAVRAAGYHHATVAHGGTSTGGDVYTLRRMAAPADAAEFERAVDGVTHLADQWRARRLGTAS
jgi:peptidoglycan/xylan/chitin deacetylase (PgdA/CDA1 family)